jgi:peptidoglycan/xylan/chitin deacetylase (PgdA/CDA1 family)
MRPLLAALALAATAACAQPAAPPTSPPARTLAVTVDDLPLNAGPAALRCDAAALAAMHGRLLDALAATGAPAVAFVNEARACDAATLDALLTRWLAAGHELGNHTATHPDLTRTSVAAYTADVVRGEPMLRRLLAARGDSLRYFRHPFLRTGETADKKDSLAAFLEHRGYTVAPVTFDSDEWVFAAAYARAVSSGDTATARRVLGAYVPWFDAVAAHYEGWSAEVLGYEPPQILLLHANLLNAAALPDLLAMFAHRGYRFVSLGEALADPAYARPDPHVGRYGSSWLHRWARGDGREVRWEPGAPDWVTAYYEAGR